MDQSVPEGQKVRTGISGLDEVLLGGLPRKHVYLVEGAPGTGKTTLALQFVLDGIRIGEKALYVALSETTAELTQVAESHSWDLSSISRFELTPVEAITKPGEGYTIFHPEEVEMKETINLILSRIRDQQPNRVVIDSLAELRLLSQDMTRYRRQVLTLKQFLTEMQVTALLLDDRTSQNMDLQVHSLVHGVITLERLPRTYGKNQRRLEVAKLRGAEYVEGFHDYVIQKEGMAVFPRMISDHNIGSSECETISSDMQGLDQMLGGGLEEEAQHWSLDLQVAERRLSP